MRGFKPVLFDCDGVLADSEHLVDRVLAEDLTARGWVLTPEESGAVFLGMALPDMAPVVKAKLGHLPPDWTEQLKRKVTETMAREVPPAGGNTSFANMYAALDLLTPETRERIAKLKMKHQASHNAQGGRRPGYKDIETDEVREMPGPLHPIIRTHPQNGRKALYLGRRFGAYIPGLTLPKSEELVEELWSVATLPQNTWAQTWKVGDLVIWDNRCTMHRRDNFSGQGRRRMHRLTTRGERPV